MDLLEGIYTRRSIRKYTPEGVNDEDVQILLKSAMLAPSAKNERLWHFVVVRDDAVKEKLSTASPYTKMAAHAPLVMVVCAEAGDKPENGLWIQDCAAATENILLAARGLELGSVWCAVYPNADRVANVRKILGLPQSIQPFNIICIGHPEQNFSEADRFMPERVHYDKWL